jgi:hypothetical protein
MASTTNYAWSTPDNSGLVKNGAQDIRTLGDAVDTALWNVGFGQAGKNKIINGDFAINQRAFTTNTTSGTYGHDRWLFNYSTGTVTYTNQTFTAGSAPVAGYEGTQFAQIVTSGQSATSANTLFDQRIEDVRTFAGQTATVSFWAKAGSGTPSIAVEIGQNFGTGGSPSADVNTYAGKTAITTSWARYSITVAIPSISGKTVGTNPNSSFLNSRFWLSAGTDFNARTGSLGVQNATIQIWGVQLEYGSKATPFETATGTIQGELAACQRYYVRFGDTTSNATLSIGTSNSAGTVSIQSLSLPVAMRVAPTALDYANIRLSDGSTGYTISSASLINGTTLRGNISCATSGMTAFRLTMLDASTTGNYVGFSAEL